MFDVRGPFSRIFDDFGDEFVVLDKDGEQVKQRWIKTISSDKEGLVEVLGSERHDLDDGDQVVISGVVGMNVKQSESSEHKHDSINETVHQVKVVSPFAFKIGDTTIYDEYVRNGRITQLKVPVTIKNQSLEECLKLKETPLDPNLVFADFETIDHVPISHACFIALDAFMQEHGRVPKAWD
mmetsp:Transcript_41235/g.47497  ORF Transcript_41235/g.47497 Transcript_41235/m.47497 type:complete len:182 (+) Transcript_41235:3967-4512(+)